MLCLSCRQTMASGATHAPVAPRSLGWDTTNRNSATPAAARSREAEVLEHDHAVVDVEGLGHDEGLVRVLGRHRAVAPRVAAGDGDAVVGEPLGHGHAGPGLAGAVGRGIVVPLRPQPVWNSTASPGSTAISPPGRARRRRRPA